MSFTDEEIAQVAHEANRALQQVLGDEQISPPWNQATQHDKDVSVAGVKIARHGAPPNALHDAWVREKEAAGWAYGEVKDAEAKTHPLLIPYESLPPEDQAKDYLFAGVCAAMNKAGEGIQRATNDKLLLKEAEALVARQAAQNSALGTGASMSFGSEIPPQPPVTVQED